MGIWGTLRNKLGSVWRMLGNRQTVKDILKVDKQSSEVNDAVYQQMEDWIKLYRGYHDILHKKLVNTVMSNVTKRTRTLNLPKLVSQYISTIIFSERVDYNIEDKGIDDYLRPILDDMHFISVLRENFEKNVCVKGGLVLKPVWDGQLGVDFIGGDDFIPTEWHDDEIVAGAFMSYSFKGGKHYTRIETHSWEDEKYVIEQRLFKSDKREEIGKEIKITELYPNLDERIEIPNLEEPLFVYLKPATANNLAEHSPLGISMFANAIDSSISADEAFDGLSDELKALKGKLILPQSALKQVMGDDKRTGTGRYMFDTNDPAIAIVHFGDNQNNKPEVFAPPMRVDDYISAIKIFMNIFAIQCGVSAGTFSFESLQVKTATEVISAKSETATTKKMYEQEINTAFQKLVRAMLRIADFNNAITYKDVKVNLLFDDSVIIDDDKMEEIARTEVKEGLRSVESYLREYRQLDDKEVVDEIARMESQFRSAMPTFDTEEVDGS